VSAGTLLDHVRTLAQLRDAKTVIDERLKAAKAAFDEQHKEDLFAQRFAVDTIAKQELVVRVLGAEVYLNTGEKKPAPGVEVKVFKTMEIVDQGAALEWAKLTNMALIPERVDEKALYKIAAATPLPFVHYSEDPKVTIGTALKVEELVEVAS
jgi:hypothetical protein